METDKFQMKNTIAMQDSLINNLSEQVTRQENEVQS